MLIFVTALCRLGLYLCVYWDYIRKIHCKSGNFGGQNSYLYPTNTKDRRYKFAFTRALRLFMRQLRLLSTTNSNHFIPHGYFQ